MSGSSQTSRSRSRSSTGRRPRPALEEEAERALGRLLEFGHRVDVAGSARIERRSRLRHVAVELGECRAVALPFRQAPARDVRERRIDGARPVFPSAGDASGATTRTRRDQRRDRQAPRTSVRRALSSCPGTTGPRFPAAAGRPAASATRRMSRGTRACRGTSS